MSFSWCARITFISGISSLLAGVNGIIKYESEEKNVIEPVHRFGHDDQNNTPYNYLHKRQINQQSQSFEPQFPPPFSAVYAPNNEDSLNRFPSIEQQQALDEEERFFLTRENPATTLNPLAFFDPQTTTTANPLQQQLAAEQRRFQQEIADKGLREQQQLSLGLPRPPPPPPPPIPNVDPALPFQPAAPFPDPLSPQTELPPSDDYDASPGFSSLVRTPNSYASLRFYRRRRSIDRQLQSDNEIGNVFGPTAAPQTFLDAILQHPTPRNDLAKIGNWLVDNFTKQLEHRIARLTGSTPKPYSSARRPHYFATYESPPNPVTVRHPETTPKIETRDTPPPVQWKLETHSSTANPETSPKVEYHSPYFVQQAPVVYTETTPKIEPMPYFVPQSSILYPDPNSKTNNPLQYTIVHAETTPKMETGNLPYFFPQPPSTVDDYAKLGKIKSVQILPSIPAEQNFLAVKSYDGNLFDTYKGLPQANLPTLSPIESTTGYPYFQPAFKTSTRSAEDSTSITSLFKTKLGEFKRSELSKSQKGDSSEHHPDFEQPHRFLEQLQQPNATSSSLIVVNRTAVTPTANYEENASGTAIFVKLPEEEPTSTVGYLFDKAITAKKLHKKENPTTKKNNRSAQIIKSSLVYRTPPGKRATVSRSEIAKNNEAEVSILSDFLETGKPVKWLLGGEPPKPTTTNRPFVTALLNFIQKRSPLQLTK